MGFVIAELHPMRLDIKPKHADDLTFIDFDHCWDKETGAIDPTALMRAQALDSYTEVSPSGTGLHVYLIGRAGRSWKYGGREVYSGGRFTTLTGQPIEGSPATINDSQDALNRFTEELAAEYATEHPQRASTPQRPAQPLNLSDEQLIRKIRDSKEAHKFHVLYDDGDWEACDLPSQSEGVMSLLCLLAWWTQKDTERMDRMFRRSALLSGHWTHKWDDPRNDTTLGAEEIAHAIEYVDGMYNPNHGNDTDCATEAVMVAANSVDEKPLYWLWGRYIPAGKASVLDGEPDKGKSAMTLDLAARLSRGDVLPDGSKSELGDGKPLASIIISCEDDLQDTIVPRLRAAKADLDYIHFLTDVTDSNGTRQPFTIPQDIPALKAAIEQTHAVFVVIDPLVGFLDGKINSNNDAQVRRALRSVHEVAQETGAAIVCLRHFKKDRQETNLLHRGGGSIGIIGAARSALAIIADPDPAFESRRYFGVTKHNLTEGAVPVLVYETVGVDISIAEVMRSVPVIRWQGIDSRPLTDISRAGAESPNAATTRGALHECYVFLERYLADHQWHRSTDVTAAVTEAGHSQRSFERCRSEWEKTGRSERRKQPNRRNEDGTTTPGYWELRLCESEAI